MPESGRFLQTSLLPQSPQTAKLFDQPDPTAIDVAGACFAPGRRMVRPLRLNIAGARYHVMSRGNARQEVFLDDDDRRHFLTLLAAAIRRFDVNCHAFCLMPNHFHLLLRIGEPTLGRTMQHLNSAYATWFNRRHRRVGHLFQGRFKAPLIEEGSYFRRAVRYVVQNPVRAGLCARCADWDWSSYRATAGLVTPPSWLAVEDIWGEFDVDADGACRAFAAFCEVADVEADDRMLTAPLMRGSTESLARLSRALAPHHRSHREFIYAERFADRPALSLLFANAHDASQRDEAARRAFEDFGYTLTEIGTLLSVSPATVWRHIRGLAAWRPRRAATGMARTKRSRSDPTVPP